MACTDRQNAWQQGSCAYDPALITTIRRPTGFTFSVFLGKE